MISAPIRVVVADDHAVLRYGLCGFIRSRASMFQLVGEATNGLEAIAVCAQMRPDVALIDLVMPDVDGIAAIERIHARQPDIRLIALTGYSNEERVQAALKAGAISYLVKSSPVDALERAIEDAYSGTATLAPEATQALVHAARRPTFHMTPLTARESEVIRLMAEGYNNSEIALQLSISLSTVKKHVSNILAKLNTTSRTEAVAIAVRANLASVG
jgi:NarL family two-component system response regulator LiaR